MINLSRIAVALSGGIDSAVAAVLLKNRGYDVIGTFINYWDPSDENASIMRDDLEDTRWFCDKLKIPLHEIDLVDEYWQNVFSNVIADYNIGSIPCADTICNEHILFGCYHRYCLNELNVDAVATGHYAKSSFGSFLEHFDPAKIPALLRSADVANDQTYILSRISQESLRKTMFPVGELTKTEIVNIAHQHSLDKFLRKEKTSDLCLMNSQLYKFFLSKYVLGQPGRFLNVDSGEFVGEHQGLHHWPPGQNYQNYYVVGNDEKNIIFVAPSKDHPALFCRSLTLSYCHWIGENLMKRLIRSSFQYSNNKTPIDGNFVNLLDYPDGGYVFLDSKKPMYAATPGQYVVMYRGDECLGSMKIINTGPCDMFYDANPDPNEVRIIKNIIKN